MVVTVTVAVAVAVAMAVTVAVVVILTEGGSRSRRGGGGAMLILASHANVGSRYGTLRIRKTQVVNGLDNKAADRGFRDHSHLLT